MGKIIIVGNQKGGVGKSTVTSLLANYIHFNTKSSVAVVDADDSQRSLDVIRQDDLKNGFIEEDLYDLLKVNSKDFSSVVPLLLNDYDFILVDVPGNLKQEGVMDIYLIADLIIIPMPPEKMVIDSTVKFIEIIFSEINPLRKSNNISPIKVGVFLNKVDQRRKEVQEILNMREKFPFDMLSEFLPNYVLFSREVTTAKIYEHKNERVNRFTKEIFAFIQ